MKHLAVLARFRTDLAGEALGGFLIGRVPYRLLKGANARPQFGANIGRQPLPRQLIGAEKRKSPTDRQGRDI